MAHPARDILPQDRRRIDALLSPRSIALLGASIEPHKWGNFIARHLLIGAAHRPIYLINNRGGEINGVATFPSLGALPETPECLVIVVPAQAAEAAVIEALEMGVRGFCIMTGGFGEISEEGRQAERRIARAVRAHGAVVIGPNCVGYQASDEAVYATRILYPEGPIGIVSQSGLVTHDLSRYAIAQKTGFSRAFNLGNQADLELAEAVESFVGHAATRALIVYCEDLRDGRAFLRAAAEVRASGIPVVLLTVGASEAAARSALSHTGAMVTPMDAMDAACRDAGILRAGTAKEALALADAFTRYGMPSCGTRVGIVTDGGGMGSLASEIVSLSGLDVPVLSTALQRELKAASGPRAGTSNPVDMAGEADYDVAAYGRVVSSLLASDEVDMVLLSAFFGGYSGADDATGKAETASAEAMLAAAEATGKPLIVHSVYPDFRTGDTLRKGGVPVFRDMDLAVAALRALTGPKAPAAWPDLPPPDAAQPVPTAYWDVRTLLQAKGVAFPEGALVASAAEARSVAASVGFPVVMKAVGLLHKSDLGGVRLGLATPDAVSAAFVDLAARFPDSPIAVERQAPLSEGIELLIGARIDPHLGPLVTVALGGIFAEVLAQSATALAPITPDAARALILSLKAAPLLTGARGRPALDVDAAAAIVVAISDVASVLRDRIDAVELNPVLVLQDRALALDARLIAADPTPDIAH